MELTNFNGAAALMLGLMGSPHCLGMCGPISALGGVSSRGRSAPLALGFQGGRLASYTLIGALAGGLVGLLGSEFLVMASGLRVFANLLLIMIALKLAGWWRRAGLIDSAVAPLWRYVQPLVRRLLPADHWSKALALGGLWGFLPCGLIYSSLAWASVQGGSSESAWLMLLFGLGTLPSMLAVGVAQRSALSKLRSSGLRSVVAVAMIAWASYSLFIVLAGHGDGPGGVSHRYHHH